MTLQWQHVDIPGKALRLPDSKTGAKVVHLDRVPQVVDAHVFEPSTGSDTLRTAEDR